MVKYILGVVIMVFLFSCDTKEKAALQNKVDSLSVQLNASKQAEAELNEVGVLIDSIDASRKALQLRMIEGSSYADYVSRLKAINVYVKETETKLSALENSTNKSSKASKASIRRLKADLAKRSEEIVDLQLQIVKLRDENLVLWTKVNRKDSLLSMNDQVIKMNESDIASLEKLVDDTQIENRIQVANLYFKQAQALELAADRTQFAPRKRKEARREALELYRLSFSLGNLDAEKKIDALEKKLG